MAGAGASGWIRRIVFHCPIAAGQIAAGELRRGQVEAGRQEARRGDGPLVVRQGRVPPPFGGQQAAQLPVGLRELRVVGNRLPVLPFGLDGLALVNRYQRQVEICRGVVRPQTDRLPELLAPPRPTGRGPSGHCRDCCIPFPGSRRVGSMPTDIDRSPRRSAACARQAAGAAEAVSYSASPKL